MNTRIIDRKFVVARWLRCVYTARLTTTASLHPTFTLQYFRVSRALSRFKTDTSDH